MSGKLMPIKYAKYYREEIEKMLKEKSFDLAELNQQKRMLYGTFGYHDSEPPHSILSRKLREVKNNQFGLWGMTINESNFDRIKSFLNDLGEEIYYFMKFTRNMSQIKNGDLDKRIWSIEEVLESGNYYTDYIGETGNIIPLNPNEMGVIVKGNERQSAALVVEDYYLFTQTFSRDSLLSFYIGTTCFSEKKQEATSLLKQAPCFLLEKKDTEKINWEDIEGNEWAIVLKLKPPYIVRCVK